MKIFMLSSSMVSLLYASSSHPVLLMLFILVQAVGICLMSWVKLKISWFSYILFLIFLGGLMVLFVYITSLASNELITMNMELYGTVFMVGTVVLIILLTNINFQTKTLTSSSVIKTFNFMYSWNSMSLIGLTMIYLLLTLIIVVKISNKFEGPIKNLIFK